MLLCYFFVWADPQSRMWNENRLCECNVWYCRNWGAGTNKSSFLTWLFMQESNKLSGKCYRICLIVGHCSCYCWWFSHTHRMDNFLLLEPGSLGPYWIQLYVHRGKKLMGFRQLVDDFSLHSMASYFHVSAAPHWNLLPTMHYHRNQRLHEIDSWRERKEIPGSWPYGKDEVQCRRFQIAQGMFNLHVRVRSRW